MSIKYKLLLTILILCTAVIWIAVFTSRDQKLRIIACDVGQGDAFLVTYGNNQILIDGGPDSSVSGCLEKHIPFWDRKIEVVILTHPQKDHYRGLVDVFEKFTVDTFIRNPIEIGTPDYLLLNNQVLLGGVRVLNPNKGLKLRLGLIYLDILWPKSDYMSQKCNLSDKSDLSENYSKDNYYSCESGIDLNIFSIVAMIRFKEFEAVFTGDISPQISDLIADEFRIRHNYDIEYIKIAHHGSKNGISKKLLDYLKPDVAVISAGKNNSYGHPHKEVIDMLTALGIEILRTDIMGDVVVEYE